MDPIFFATPTEMRDWLARHHATEREVFVVFHKLNSGRPNLTWSESVDEALCVGWIDGVRRRIDDLSYTTRFTPRRKGSIWSAVNIRKVAVLTAEGRMQPAGLAAFAERRENKSAVYSYENRPAELPGAHLEILLANPAALAFFEAQPPSYRRTAIWQIVSAKQEATQQKRLAKLIAACVARKRLF